MGLPLPCLMLVTEPSPRLPEIIAEAVAGGVNTVQWREKVRNGAHYRQRCVSIRKASGDSVPVLVNGNWEAALACGARHIHLPEKSLPLGVARWRLGGNGLIGKSVHSLEGALKAQADGADYLVAGSIFASASHPDIAPAGLEFLREVCAAITIPVVAIGGVTPENVGECILAGAAGAAVLSPLMTAEDPREVAQAYFAAIIAAREQVACS